MDTYKKPNPDDELLRKTTAQKPETAQGNGFQYSQYQPSDTVKQAQEMLKQQMAQKPGSYQSPWQSQLNDIMGKIMNREKFSYDLNGDALYQQYKDQYVLQGQRAMMDTMGQAAALTGGYGNSYAQQAGQQAYHRYLQQMNDKIPELYRLALDKYQMEGQDLMNQYSMLGAKEEQDYGRYRDQVSDYNAEVDRLQNWYDAERDFDYGQWADGRDFAYGQYADDRAYAYQQERDQVADQQWQAEFDEAKRQYDQQHALTQQKNNSPRNPGKGDDSTGDNPKTGDNTGGSEISENAIKHMQITLGLDADGKWDAADQQAAGGLGLEEAYKQWNQGKLEGASPVNEGKVKSFMSKLHTEKMHDAIERDKWGSYKQYVAYQIEHSSLSNAEKAYLISHYGIRESDTHYKNA